MCLLQNAAREADILAEVGDGGFAAQEFELLEQIGQLSWVRTDHSAPLRWLLNCQLEQFL